MALLIQAIIALGLSFFSSLPDLISFSVFNLGFSFLLVSLSLAALHRKRKKELRGERVLPWLGVAICLYLIYYTSLLDKIFGAALILLGIPLYVYFSPKVDIHDLKQFWTSESTIVEHNLERENVFLANWMRIGRRIIRKRRTRKQTPLS